MLDLNLIRENPEILKADLKKRNRDTDLVERLLALDAENRELLKKVEKCRAEKNAASEGIAKLKGPEKQTAINEMKKVSEQEKAAHEAQQKVETELHDLLLTLPNLTHSSTPAGLDESGNQVEKLHGTPKTFDFPVKDHIELGTALGILDLEDATRMSGTRFAYLLGAGALLEFALIQFVMHKLVSKGFTPVIPPVLVREQAMIATGFFPADRNEIYHVNPKTGDDDKENDDLYLVGTAEVPLTMLHADKILDEEKLPLRYVGFSTCFRREAGSYGKDTAGIIRVHQFDKIEMFSFCHPDKSWEEHELIRSIEEEIMQELGFAYQVLNICSGDLGYPASKKYDLEVWIPSQGKYRELTSCSNCTDYQARRAKIRYKAKRNEIPFSPIEQKIEYGKLEKGLKSNKTQYVHTLNGTACAMGRTLVAILENYQRADGTIEVPHVLQPYMNGLTLISP